MIDIITGTIGPEGMRFPTVTEDPIVTKVDHETSQGQLIREMVKTTTNREKLTMLVELPISQVPAVKLARGKVVREIK